jgi:hypothetical protein
MAKIKPAGSRRTTTAKSNKGLIPCSILIISAFALLMLLFYEILKSGVK